MEQALRILQVYGPGIGIYLLVASVVGLFMGLRKGQGLRGFVFGAVLGPLGWFLATRWDSKGKSCAECGGINPGNPRLCRHCGINLRVAAQRSERSRIRGGSDGWR